MNLFEETFIKHRNLVMSKQLNEIKVTPEMEKQIVDLYNDGWSSLKIAKELKLGQRTILKKLIKHKIDRRSHSNKVTPEIEKQIIDLYLQDNSSYQISKLLKLDSTTVIDVLKKNKVPRRSASDAMLTYHTNKVKDNSRKYHSTRIIGQGTVPNHHFDGSVDNTGFSREIPKRLGGHSSTH